MFDSTVESVDFESPEDSVLGFYCDAFSQTVPHRVVTRSFSARDDISDADLKKGTFSLLYQGERNTDDDVLVMLQVLVVGQIEIKEQAKPADVEKAELKLLHEFRRFSNSQKGSEFHIKNVGTSHQMEHPYGWVMISCELGPVDLSCIELELPAADAVAGEVPNVGLGHETAYRTAEEITGEC